MLRQWLTANVASGAREGPLSLAVEVTLHPAPGGPIRLRHVLAGIVNTDRGPCYLELATVTRLPTREQPQPAPPAQKRDPAVISVTLRTTDHPLGVHLEFDATAFLEAVAREYFRRRPMEVPISQPTARRGS